MLVWHYTSVDALFSILDENIWRASSLDSVNDTDEIEIGLRVLRDSTAPFLSTVSDTATRHSLEEIIATTSEEIVDRSAFIVSFSELPDDNSLWERYAGPAGVAIGISRQEHLRVFDRTHRYSSPWEDPGGNVPMTWVQMAYSPQEHREKIQTALGVCLWLLQGRIPDLFGYPTPQDAAVDVLCEAISSIKQEGFQSEREWRFTVRHPWDSRLVRQPAGGGRFVELTGPRAHARSTIGTLTQKRSFSSARRTRLPVAVVRVGPASRHRWQEIADRVWVNHPMAAVLPSLSTLRVD